MTTNEGQEIPEAEETVEEPEGNPEDALTPEQLRAELAKVRREAASRRVLTREQEKKLSEYEDFKRSQLSEAERLKQERDELAAKVQASETDKLQRKAARAAKLPADLADRIRGNTEEEMLADAQEIAKKLQRTANSLMPGTRGTAVGTGAARSEDDWFRKLFNDAK